MSKSKIRDGTNKKSQYHDGSIKNIPLRNVFGFVEAIVHQQLTGVCSHVMVLATIYKALENRRMTYKHYDSGLYINHLLHAYLKVID